MTPQIQQGTPPKSGQGPPQIRPGTPPLSDPPPLLATPPLRQGLPFATPGGHRKGGIRCLAGAGAGAGCFAVCVEAMPRRRSGSQDSSSSGASLGEALAEACAGDIQEEETDPLVHVSDPPHVEPTTPESKRRRLRRWRSNSLNPGVQCISEDTQNLVLVQLEEEHYLSPASAALQASPATSDRSLSGALQ